MSWIWSSFHQYWTDHLFDFRRIFQISLGPFELNWSYSIVWKKREIKFGLVTTKMCNRIFHSYIYDQKYANSEQFFIDFILFLLLTMMNHLCAISAPLNIYASLTTTYFSIKVPNVYKWSVCIIDQTILSSNNSNSSNEIDIDIFHYLQQICARQMFNILNTFHFVWTNHSNHKKSINFSSFVWIQIAIICNFHSLTKEPIFCILYFRRISWEWCDSVKIQIASDVM